MPLQNAHGQQNAAAMKKLPQLFGGIEVLDEARALTDEPAAIAAIDYLRAIYEELKKAGLSDGIMIEVDSFAVVLELGIKNVVYVV